MTNFEQYTQDIKILSNKNYTEKEIIGFMEGHPYEPSSKTFKIHVIKTTIKNMKNNC